MVRCSRSIMTLAAFHSRSNMALVVALRSQPCQGHFCCAPPLAPPYIMASATDHGLSHFPFPGRIATLLMMLCSGSIMTLDAFHSWSNMALVAVFRSWPR